MQTLSKPQPSQRLLMLPSSSFRQTVREFTLSCSSYSVSWLTGRTSCSGHSSHRILPQECQSSRHAPERTRWFCEAQFSSRRVPFGSGEVTVSHLATFTTCRMPYLHDAVRLRWVLVFLDIFLQLGEWYACTATRPCAARVFAQEFVQNFAQQLMGHETRILVVGDDDPRNTFGSRVCVERILLLFNILSLSWLGALCDGFGKHGQELAYAAAGETREGGELGLGAELHGGLVFIL